MKSLYKMILSLILIYYGLYIHSYAIITLSIFILAHIALKQIKSDYRYQKYFINRYLIAFFFSFPLIFISILISFLSLIHIIFLNYHYILFLDSVLSFFICLFILKLIIIFLKHSFYSSH